MSTEIIETVADLEGYITRFLMLSPSRRRIFQYILWCEKTYNGKAFPSMERIARFAGISVRSIQRFFEDLGKSEMKPYFFRSTKRFNSWRGQSTNLYSLNNNFKLAIEWLKKNNKLNVPRKERMKVVLSMGRSQKRHPPTPKNVTPLSVPISIKIQTLENPVWQHHLLLGINSLDARANAFAKRYSDFLVIDTLEACRYHAKKGRILNESAYFTGVLRNKARRLGK